MDQAFESSPEESSADCQIKTTEVPFDLWPSDTPGVALLDHTGGRCRGLLHPQSGAGSYYIAVSSELSLRLAP